MISFHEIETAKIYITIGTYTHEGEEYPFLYRAESSPFYVEQDVIWEGPIPPNADDVESEIADRIWEKIDE